MPFAENNKPLLHNLVSATCGQTGSLPASQKGEKAPPPIVLCSCVSQEHRNTKQSFQTVHLLGDRGQHAARYVGPLTPSVMRTFSMVTLASTNWPKSTCPLAK